MILISNDSQSMAKEVMMPLSTELARDLGQDVVMSKPAGFNLGALPQGTGRMRYFSLTFLRRGVRFVFLRSRVAAQV